MTLYSLDMHTLGEAVVVADTTSELEVLVELQCGEREAVETEK